MLSASFDGIPLATSPQLASRVYLCSGLRERNAKTHSHYARELSQIDKRPCQNAVSFKVVRQLKTCEALLTISQCLQAQKEG
jgi:hypothetical protein